MNRKIALVTLIEASLFFSDEDKLALIERVPSLNDKQVETLGKFLAAERQFALDHEAEIRHQFDQLIADMEDADNTVYVGSGKPM